MVFSAFVDAGLWPGLGRTTAAALPAAGVVCPADVSVSALRRVPRMLHSRAERLVASFCSVAGTYELAGLLVGAGLPACWAGPLGRLAGAEIVRADPWRLLDVPEVRLGDADRLARVLLPGVRPDDPRRGRALVVHALVQAARDGSTCLSVEDLVRAVSAESVAQALADERVHGEDGWLALARYALAEQDLADGVVRLLSAASPVAGAAAVAAVGEDLDAAQREAVAQALEHGVSVLTGGPGTGKSRTVAALVRLATARGQRVALAAPTGRAAKRLEELCGVPATTLHRLLGAQGLGTPGAAGGFSRDGQWPLDEDVVVVDEASMLDVELAAALVVACADGAHLVLVGDPAQLPSIGPGRVLGDLLDSGAVAVTELTTLYRQAEGGAIARLATAVRAGVLPAVPDDPSREVVIVRAGDAAEAAHRTVQLVCEAIPRALGIASGDVQVVTPVHRGPAGTVALNAALKARLNPGDGEVAGFDVGDRVVATANHLEDGFANGDVGVVTAARSGALVVAFAGAGPVDVPARAVGDLAHGWAVTVHRAQGSEFPAVVAVLTAEAGGLLSRPLLYTAFTRAQRHLSVVHSAGAALSRAVREVGARPRQTRLLALVREAAEAAGLSTSPPGPR